MLERLRLHTVTLLKFYLRSRLLLSFAAVLLGLWLLGLVPFFLTGSSGDRFETLKAVSWQLQSFSWFYTAAIGLFALWTHVHQRNTSMIFTRPGAPQIWLASVFLSAIIVAAAIHAAAAAVTFVLSVAWGIPYQIGFLWLAFDGIIESIVIVSILTGLAAAIHPVIAVLALLFLNESMFLWLDTMLLGAAQASEPGIWLTLVERAVRALYTIAPMLDPFASKTAAVSESLRVSLADWGYLGGGLAYAALVFVLFFFFADHHLRRRLLTQ